MRFLLRASLFAMVALASLVALSGGLSSGAAGAATGAPPWDVAAPFPSSYDLRTSGRVTPVRSQEDYGTCWVMAATGSLESATLTAEGRALDFSENNLADHMASQLVYQGMAPSELAAAYYARWEGPVLESSDPYPRPGRSPEYLRAVRHVQEVLFLPQRAPGTLDNDAVKWAVMTYGGVDAAIDFDVNAKYRFWNAETSSYYARRAELDHHVLCVGWDDEYSADRFAIRPPGDGAFLIKNSWNTGFGEQGYFWLSYYDASFGKALAVFDGVASVDDYDAVYQYDALGRSGWVGAGGGESAWYASRFSCAGSGDVAAVSFYTPVPGTEYEVRVAGSVQDVASAPIAATGTVPVAGYHTIRLEHPVAVTAGGDFVAAVRVRAPGWNRPVPVERPTALIAPRARAGQSYLSADGAAWSDLTARAGLSRANVCLKAFVTASGAGDTQPPRVDVTGGVVRRGGTAEVRWRLTDPSFSSASAIVVLTVRDGGGVVARVRIPAVAVGERGTWSFRAAWPAARYHVTGRAYDVAGMRQATASHATIVVRGSAPPAARAGLPRR